MLKFSFKAANAHIANLANLFKVAGITGEVSIIFAPFPAATAAWTGVLVRNIEPDTAYTAYYFDPITGNETDLGEVTPDSEGNWKAGFATIVQDWILVLEAAGARV